MPPDAPEKFQYIFSENMFSGANLHTFGKFADLADRPLNPVHYACADQNIHQFLYLA